MSSLALRSWTREEFHHAAEAGVFGPSEKLELLDGQIVTKMTQNAPHVFSVLAVSDWLRAVVESRSSVRVQMPVALGDRSEPEPDVSVVRGAHVDYLTDHPTPKDVLLIVEVSDSSLREDKEYKTRLYARAGVPEVWIMALPSRRLIHYSTPDAGEYTRVEVLTDQETIGFAGSETPISRFFPPR